MKTKLLQFKFLLYAFAVVVVTALGLSYVYQTAFAYYEWNDHQNYDLGWLEAHGTTSEPPNITFSVDATSTVFSVTYRIKGTISDEEYYPRPYIYQNGVYHYTAVHAPIDHSEFENETFSFDPPIEIVPGTFTLSTNFVGATPDDFYLAGASTSPFDAGDVALGNPLTGSMYYFEIDNSLSDPLNDIGVTIVPLPDIDPTTTVESETVYAYPENQTCYLEDDCYITAYYPRDEIGNYFKFYQVSDDEYQYPIAIGTSTELIDSPYAKMYLKLTPPTASGTAHYIIWLDRPEIGVYQDFVDETYGGYWIEWRGGHESEDVAITYTPEYVQCMKINENFASSSDLNLWQNIMRWAVAPSENACIRIAKAQKDIVKNFPFSYGHQILSLLENATSTGNSLNVPLKWWNPSTGTYIDTGADLLSTSTLSTALNFGNIDGLTVYQFYWKWFNYLIYGLGFLYILWRILSLINPNFTTPKRHVDWTNVYDRPQRTQIIKQPNGSHKIKIIED